MAVTLDWYTDAGLTQPLAGDLLTVLEKVDGSLSPVVHELYLGSTTPDRVFRDSASPGAENLTLSIVHAIPEWAAGDYVVGDQVRTTAHNGYKYEATVGGTTGGTEPSPWPTTIGETIVDGGVTWQCVAKTHEPEEIEMSMNGTNYSSPGAALDMGITEILSGSAGAVRVWLRFDDATGVVATTEEVTIMTQDLQETGTA